MKVLIDTNILISAALFPNSIPFKAYAKAVSFPYQAIVCEQNIDEMKRIFALLTALVLACALTACGGTGTQSSPGQGMGIFITLPLLNCPEQPVPASPAEDKQTSVPA